MAVEKRSTKPVIDEKGEIARDQDGKPLVEESYVRIEGIQPENPQEPTKIKFEEQDGSVLIDLPSSNSPSPPTPSEKSLGYLTIVGGIATIVGIGLAVGFIGTRWGLQLGGGVAIGGVILMGISAGISKAMMPIGIAVAGLIVALTAILAVTWFKWYKDKKARVQTERGIDEFRYKFPDLWTKLKDELEKEQDDDVKRLIKHHKRE
ncbi:MAG: membrane protein of unknown function [Promethearchaeota archaeon]|nr:MAG: membrane protein of unknown function [Candidatus Lokiarchaeota archaeon]